MQVQVQAVAQVKDDRYDEPRQENQVHPNSLPAVLILGPPAYYWEYSISEKDFLRALSSYQDDFEEIDEPVSVPRYLERVLARCDFYANGEFDDEAFREATHATIADGLVYEDSIEDRRTVIAFDRQTARAYRHLTTR